MRSGQVNGNLRERWASAHVAAGPFSRDRYRVLGVRISVKAKANNGVHLIQPPERHRNETERSQADYIRS
jgi:hypothetical protein